MLIRSPKWLTMAAILDNFDARSWPNGTTYIHQIWNIALFCPAACIDTLYFSNFGYFFHLGPKNQQNRQISELIKYAQGHSARWKQDIEKQKVSIHAEESIDHPCQIACKSIPFYSFENSLHQNSQNWYDSVGNIFSFHLTPLIAPSSQYWSIQTLLFVKRCSRLHTVTAFKCNLEHKNTKSLLRKINSTIKTMKTPCTKRAKTMFVKIQLNMKNYKLDEKVMKINLIF